MYEIKRITKAVIDTGPLFTALTLDFARRNPELGPFLMRKHQLPPFMMADQVLQNVYREFFERIHQFIITSHIVGEMRSRYHIPSEIQYQFIECAMDYLKRRRLDERLIRILAIEDDSSHRHIACSNGFIDAGVLKLAREEKCVLLTDDGRLWTWVNETGPEIELLKNVVYEPS
jgi:hypothetical protein